MSETEYIALYKSNLLDDVVPFWANNSIDDENGGFFTCLSKEGEVYDTDKFIWLQCRQVWTFSMLYLNVEKNPAWLEIAENGAAFLIKHGRNENKDWYFSLTKEGKPLVQAYNIFSDCFASMAFAQLSKATGNSSYAEIARETFDNILKRQNNPKGKYSKAYPGTRDLQGFSLPMILCNLVLEIEHLLDSSLVEDVLKNGVDTVVNKFYKPEYGLILENIDLNNNFNDSYEGRLINPGHGLESMWFVMDIAERNNDTALIRKCVDISLSILEFGWDKENRGIFYFLDVKGNPPQQLEWDQKLWWVHIESMITMLKGYLHTGDERCWEWFEKLHEYTWEHFVDEEFGEWYGYLNRKGEILLPLKGGKWKGCFHVPRGLFQLWKTMERVQQKKKIETENLINS
ncbi:AGE family epimerase/isomerase [Pedobacter heparinus]|uniref:N-acylglucosamine 2-epimerase n=1 Tax=Pedobacter heparinus (strain ATCC 13125 / DSM 2366 / CIP 104194 / JCM 7457 / NBRC 12017 / NCIMB 9290 / NRRL B-14731 / HIM 762-3) TaxID=485917 RepID=C6Y2H5_PEDHD|nr:AGE family epimerase/isomerase [Pedobacter heparinus]ACU05185.1 N-acylglucosamine 2-epimerase [Pedobacter heparinus DSM 2366]